jgi:hypothetical protein
VAGNDNRDGITSTGLPYCLCRNAKRFGDVAVGTGLAEGDRGHGGADRALEIAAFDLEREIEVFQAACVIGHQLATRLKEHISIVLDHSAPPPQGGDVIAFRNKDKIAELSGDGAGFHPPTMAAGRHVFNPDHA